MVIRCLSLLFWIETVLTLKLTMSSKSFTNVLKINQNNIIYLFLRRILLFRLQRQIEAGLIDFNVRKSMVKIISVLIKGSILKKYDYIVFEIASD